MAENDLMFIRQGTFVEEMVGYQDYNDLATQTTPIEITQDDTWYTLTNDGLGPYTSSEHAVLGKPEVWDTTTNQFYFGDLFLGSMLILRTDILFATGSNSVEVLTRLRMGIGSGAEYYIPLQQIFLRRNNRTYQVGSTMLFTIDNEITRDYPAEIQLSCDDDEGEVTINGWKIMTIDRF